MSRGAWEAELLSRLRQSTGTLRFSRIAELTGTHPETVRRYMTRGRPSGYFIAALCSALDLSPEWVLFGKYGQPSKGQSGALETKPGAGARSTVRLSPSDQ